MRSERWWEPGQVRPLQVFVRTLTYTMNKIGSHWSDMIKLTFPKDYLAFCMDSRLRGEGGSREICQEAIAIIRQGGGGGLGQHSSREVMRNCWIIDIIREKSQQKLLTDWMWGVFCKHFHQKKELFQILPQCFPPWVLLISSSRKSFPMPPKLGYHFWTICQ